MKWLYTIFVILAILCLSTTLLNWMVNDDPTELFFHTRIHQPTMRVIKSIDIEFKDRRILFDVHTTQSLTCEELIRELGVSHFTFNDRTFSPTCSHVSPTHMKIVYQEPPLL